ncbi:MAG: hypothetical protein KF773_01655 [Deltaproteobacteria bacterium]|nr:hypothetical protein [Deltaproteobacteria bacterium]MCW5800874.1 hypothetical protein [Deltaproteobacteria bacterium]
MKTLTICAMALAMAACGGKKDDAKKEEAKDDALTCAQVADKAVAALGDRGGPVKDKLRPIYEERCTQDKWPADVMACFATASGFEALQGCRQRLVFEPREKLIQQIRGVMGAMGGGMGGRPPMGHGGAGSDAKAPAP